MTQSRRFLRLFNELDDYLRHLTGLDQSDHSSFGSVLAQAAERNQTVRRHKRRLQQLGNLRNAIVHQNGPNEEPIAEPHEQVVDDLEACIQAIKNPPRLGSFGSAPLPPFSPDDEVGDALLQMRDKDFSQVIVGVERLSLLTTEGIARWIEHRVRDEIIELKGVRIGEVLAHEPKGTFHVMKRGNTLYDARAAFIRAARKPERLFAILVTANGRDDEKPLSIVTPIDLLRQES
jgi:hypothetical protein